MVVPFEIIVLGNKIRVFTVMSTGKGKEKKKEKKREGLIRWLKEEGGIENAENLTLRKPKEIVQNSPRVPAWNRHYLLTTAGNPHTILRRSFGSNYNIVSRHIIFSFSFISSKLAKHRRHSSHTSSHALRYAAVTTHRPRESVQRQQCVQFLSATISLSPYIYIYFF